LTVSQKNKQCQDECDDPEEPQWDYLAVQELLRQPKSDLPRPDQRDLISHAASRGIRNFRYGKDYHCRLLSLAEKAHLTPEAVAQFDRDFNYIHWMTLKVKAGTINSISGMCYDIAIKNYSEIAKIILKQAAGSSSKRSRVGKQEKSEDEK